MLRSKATPPGARVPLLVLVAALAAGAVIYFGVHRHDHGAAERGSRSVVASPGHAPHAGAPN